MNGAKPNDAHIALAQYKIPVITMNIDGLHKQAGSDALELHGGLPEDDEMDIAWSLYNKPVLYGDPAPNYAKAYEMVYDLKPGDIFLVIGCSFHTAIAVDLREGSETFGKWFGIVLTAENKKQFFVPKNFAHGFIVLSDYAEFCYKVTDFYHPNDEGGILWNDPAIGVEWPMPEGMTQADLILSDKDKVHGGFDAYCKERGIVR